MFKISEHLDKLENVKHHMTWGEATCPVCQGTLKFSKSGYKADSYACYTSQCHTIKDEFGRNRIKSKLQVSSHFRNSTVFRQSNLFKSVVKVMESPIPIEDKLNLVSTIPFVAPYRKTSNQGKTRHIHFVYDKFTYVRVDTITEDGVDKYFYPLHKNANGVTVKGIPLDSGLPIYKTEYLQKDILMVEGEKCAAFLQRLGLAAVCINTVFLSDTVLKDVMIDLKERGVQNILYLPDNDYSGQTKATLIMQSAWYAKINADVLNLIDFYVEYSELQGFDIVDLYLKNRIASKEDVLDIIERWRNSSE
jgi:hypothetical protein